MLNGADQAISSINADTAFSNSITTVVSATSRFPGEEVDVSKTVAMTKHGRMRANGRGFSNALIELIQGHGTWVGERQVLDSRDLRACLDAIDAVRRSVIRLLDKGGGTAVFDEDGRLITIFSPRTYRPSRRTQRAGMVGG
jgi:hypothetical protein